MTERDTARALDHPEAAAIRLEGVLHALSDPLRLSIVQDLAGSATELACSYFDLPVTKSTTTHHFRVLRESGLVRQTYRGTTKLNALRRAELEDLFPGLLDSVLTAAAAEEARSARILS
ncbi:helix-turn-helix domain-containing protein [Streptomyces sp. NBC_00190]|uniref:ArsR/SmtB family transcription factor n=1 Tax=unclassified Streptomyces TaxID=2593676 RepID=UPI002E2BFAAD|nr:helix-turn-helix domain-containing protein [Streptomyces sp. NBC_00190]WSZ39051.1 helix-turn-helix domain-containing protein [Streptomyces sp. NBC_00868]